MRTWFYRHPNVPFILAVVWFVVAGWTAVDLATDRRWGWFVAVLISGMEASRRAAEWWERT